MTGEPLQPLGTIGPIDSNNASENEGVAVELSQAQQDYKEGRDALKNDDLAQAGMCFHNALKGFEQENNMQGVANAFDRLGDVCLAKEEFESAIQHYRKAYEICEQEEDPFSIQALNKKLAVAYKKLGDYEKALPILFDIFDYYSEVRNPQGSVQVLEVIAEVYVLQGDKEKAADTYKTIASIHANFGHKKEAESFSNKALQVTK